MGRAAVAIAVVVIALGGVTTVAADRQEMGPPSHPATVQEKLMETQGAGPTDGGEEAAVPAAAGRRVLDGVPGFRYIQDGLNPFALSLNAGLSYLGEPRAYGDLMADSGACFRMAWNHTGWDEGNMDLSHLEPEPVRRGVQCAGQGLRFYMASTRFHTRSEGRIGRSQSLVRVPRQCTP